jgi:subtilisin family serine protease
MTRRVNATRTLHVLALLGAIVLTGCATAGRDAPPAPLSTSNGYDEERLIVLTVRNSKPSTPPAPASVRRGYSGGSYAASDSALAAMQSLTSDYQLTQIVAWPIEALHVHCAVLRIPAGASRDELLQRLMRDRRVELAQRMNSFVSSTTTYNDPYIGLQRGLVDIDAPAAQQWSRGEHVRVAVIDTGIDEGHPDFGGRIRVRRNFVDRDATRFAHDRHGTAVAGVISASANNRVGIVGVAPAVSIVALKACWQLGSDKDPAACNSLTLAKALAAAIDEQVQVVNLSLTGPHDPLLNSLVAAGVARGILYVGAAPHDSDANGFPASAPGIIPVDASESGRTRPGVLRAPGRDVVTLVPGGRYDFLSGPSLATAHVTGAVALLLSRSPRLDRDSVYRLLMNSSDAGNPAPELPINVCIALTSMIAGATCTHPAISATSKPLPAARIDQRK